jgi:hypothetical protein
MVVIVNIVVAVVGVVSLFSTTGASSTELFCWRH